MADIEQECYELKAQFTEKLNQKEMEIEMLRKEVMRLQGSSRDSHDTGIQVSDDTSSDM